MPGRLTPLRILWALVCAVAGFSALFAGAAQVSRAHQPTVGLVFMTLVVAIVSVPIHVYLHELGHLSAAVVLRLPVAGTVGRTTVRIGLWGRDSMVRCVPSPEQPFLRARLIAMILAGPGVNLITAIGCYLAGTAVGSGPWRLVLSAIGGAAAWVGIRNLIPQTHGDTPTDGRRVIRWLLRPEGLRTSLMLEHLAWRAKSPGNRWRSFEDLRPAPDNQT
ncbi:hypothetical protein [Allorhizocola rhizosphaerae]|uniref:hypothetical protein n=1 Tax=Allorhizocola rhizosphaerae TaxID=1872709 RepID=UPI000E3DE38F|nr:hypothetical protein [Allorhizocola rhizosphaerae]